MITAPEPHEIEDVASLEWRRYFDDRPDRTALTYAALIAALAALVFSGAIVYSSHPSFVIAWIGGGTAVAGVALFLAGISGVVPSRRNRVTVKGGVTYVRDRANRPMLSGFFTTWAGIITVGVGVILMDWLGAVELSNERRFPLFIVAVAAMILVFLWFLAFVRVGKRLGFSPQGIVGRFNSTEVVIPWGSIRELNTYDGPSAQRPLGLGRRTEIAFSTTSEASFPAAPIGADIDSYPIALAFFDVDEDTLFNVIHAAHTHPEVRELFGREEGTILFDGPPAKTRKAMPASEVWTPWGQKIRAALDAQAGAERAADESSGPTVD